MATEERYVLNQMALRNLTQATGIGEALPDFKEYHFVIGLSRAYEVVKGAVTTTATFTAPPKQERSFLGLIIDDLDRLKLRSNPSFRPSGHAMRSARFYIFETYARIGNAFPRPSFVLDGENGIIIKWVKNGYTVRLNCLPNESDDDYIYFENGEYDTEDNVTLDVLENRLNWLIQHEREPPR